MKILIMSMHETLLYAAEELKKYIVGMSRGAINPDFDLLSAPRAAGEGEIILGTFDQLNIEADDLIDPVLEDIIEADIREMSGYIAGSNERSVLMGVYRLCASAGCRYIRPGEDGDYVPYVPELASHSFKYSKKADKQFRGECTEGAVSYEHIRDTVYFLPKIGMNMYMIEGLVPYTYMHKWYGHVYNDKLRTPGQITDYDMLYKYVKLLERDIKKTGIQLHTLGHAWMYEKFGISHKDPASEQAAMAKLTDEQKSLFALLKGKRDLNKGNTFYTHLCYSNPAAREILVSYMLEYAMENPHVDYIHFWLADSTNNQCECDECAKYTPTDWYVMMLNELDERLTAAGLDTRIALIAYVETVRPPEKIMLKNPGRFVLISAIGHFYETGYRKTEFCGEIPPFVRNNYKDQPVELRLKWVNDWKKLCDNIPSVVFEYRFYKDMYCDPSYMKISRETYRDMRNLDLVSFDGCMSDQTHRMYLPTSLPLVTMGETLFDTSLDFDRLADDYFLGSFGDDGGLVREYLEGMTEMMSPSNFRIGGKFGVEEEGLGSVPENQRSWINNPSVVERAERVEAYVDAFMPVIERNLSAAVERVRMKSWMYMMYHSTLAKMHARYLIAGAKGDTEALREEYLKIRAYLSEHELELHDVFDGFLYIQNMAQKASVPLTTYYQ